MSSRAESAHFVHHGRLPYTGATGVVHRVMERGG